MFATILKCVACGNVHKLNEAALVCAKCGDILDVEYDLNEIRNHLNKELLSGRDDSLWRYRELLPIARDDCITSLGEGLTPLTRVHRYGDSLGLDNLALKQDHLNPTGSFKDRGSTVNVSKLRELNIASVMDDSSGNAASSLAAYCASAGIECTLFVPTSAPTEKLVQAQIYGATIVKIDGSRTDVAATAQKAWRTGNVYYASHNISAFFFEGMKTVAYEIAEALHWHVPDHIVFPVGGGALLAGAWKGFDEMKKLTWIRRVPRLHCIQSDACKPIVNAFRKGSKIVEATTEGETLAGGIRISKPTRGSQVLEALERTDGFAECVTDRDILKHQRLLAQKEGIFVEPTSCAALAGLEKLHKGGVIGSHDSVVVPLTGFGLKDIKSAASLLTGDT